MDSGCQQDIQKQFLEVKTVQKRNTKDPGQISGVVNFYIWVREKKKGHTVICSKRTNYWKQKIAHLRDNQHSRTGRAFLRQSLCQMKTVHQQYLKLPQLIWTQWHSQFSSISHCLCSFQMTLDFKNWPPAHLTWALYKWFVQTRSGLNLHYFSDKQCFLTRCFTLQSQDVLNLNGARYYYPCSYGLVYWLLWWPWYQMTQNLSGSQLLELDES